MSVEALGLHLTMSEASSLLRNSYGLEAQKLWAFDSELSAVYGVQLSTARVVLKAARFERSEHRLQGWRVAAMGHARAAGLPVAATIPSLTGDDVAQACTVHGQVTVHVEELIVGVPLEASAPDERTYRDVGRVAAELSRALEDWPESPEPINHPWELVRTADVIDACIAKVQDRTIRELIHEALLRFRETVVPLLPWLPRAVVHHDLHDSNLLIAQSTGLVSGILDFGDMVVGPRVAELAVAAGYAARTAPDPLAAYLGVVDGWGRIVPLAEEERAILFRASLGRLAVNLAVWSSRASSDRAPYAHARSSTSARALTALLGADEGHVNAALAYSLTFDRRP